MSLRVLTPQRSSPTLIMLRCRVDGQVVTHARKSNIRIIVDGGRNGLAKRIKRSLIAEYAPRLTLVKEMAERDSCALERDSTGIF